MRSLVTARGASATQFTGQSVTSHASRTAYGDANSRRLAMRVAVRGAAGCFIQGTLIAGRRQRLARIVVDNMTD